MNLICKSCNKKFIPSHSVELRYIKNTEGNYFCSKSCSAKFNKNYKKSSILIKTQNENTDIAICKNCNNTFNLTKYQKNRLKKEISPNLFCSKSCSAKWSNLKRDESWKNTRIKTNRKLYNQDAYVNKEKISRTIKRLYSERDDYGFKSSSYKLKMKQKYETDNISKSDWLKEYNLNKYGTEYYFQSGSYKQQTKNTNLSKYGCLYHMQSPEQIQKFRQMVREKYNVNWITEVPEVQQKIKSGIRKTFNKQNEDETTTRYISNINKSIGNILKDNNIDFKYEYFIYPRWYDIQVGTNLLEINPSITHNILFNPYGDAIDKNYHLNKSKLAKSNNFNCIHIFDWDNIDKIIQLLTPKTILYARKLTIKQVESTDCNEFINSYHLQNTCKGQTIRLGLYKDNELVQIMTFGKPRYNKNYEYELLRLCTKPMYKVVGGSAKLFNYFIKSFKPKSILSYCDNSKFSGQVYSRLNFKLINKGECSLHWYNIESKKHITDNLLRQRGFSQLHDDINYEKYKKGDNNEQLMIDNKYLPVYDCGQSTYVWQIIDS